MTSTPDFEQDFRDTRAAEVAGHAVAVAALQTETPEQLHNVLTDINEVLQGAVPDVEVVTRDRHEVEHERALKVDKLLGMAVLPSALSAKTKLTIFEGLLDRDERISKALNDERSVEDKGATHYRRLLRQTRAKR